MNTTPISCRQIVWHSVAASAARDDFKMQTSSIMGVTSQAIIRAIVAGERGPLTLAQPHNLPARLLKR